jgi:Domain of unknown function (DUF4062)
MKADALNPPRLIQQVTVSGTFTDLMQHRASLIECIGSYGLAAIAMGGSAKPMDLIESSLQMVRDGAAYVGVISLRYGNIPLCPVRNPDGRSITELEFDEALRLKRPILLFIMGVGHLVRVNDLETDPVKRNKLDAFRERAKQMSSDSSVQRVYAEFNSLEEFKETIGPSIADLRRHLEAQSSPTGVPSGQVPLEGAPIPKPPFFYAEPRYIVSNTFVGRQSELEVLSDWALPADPHTMLLLEAIGGNGKSMLTWEWVNSRATTVRRDWAGRFWYSFYEKGADMADFCRRAIAYMTGQRLSELRKKKTRELIKYLVAELYTKPWLLILDGLERVLVAYHSIDAAEISDEEANNPTDKIVSRDPCSAIRDEDDDLLRSLAAVTPSKVLVSSRLMPRVLLNAANQAIPGVRRISLPGLRPPDAEALLYSYNIVGGSEAIQRYLAANCDCHPLIIGVLAGLINNYLPDRGNFDRWVVAPDGGGRLDLARLNLIQRRNHILSTALHALPQKSEQLLSTLALLPESVDYSVLSALNPHLPPEPDEVDEPPNPKEYSQWGEMSAAEKSDIWKEYESALVPWNEYQRALEARLQSTEFGAAAEELERTVYDLERRGLLQYDARAKRYDLHPVVRAIAVRGLQVESKERYGQRIVDYFSRQPEDPHEDAETIEDVRNALNLIRALLKIGHHEQATEVYTDSLNQALVFNLEACAEALSLLRPLFDRDWNFVRPDVYGEGEGYYLTAIARSLNRLGELEGALQVLEALLNKQLAGLDSLIEITLIEMYEVLCLQNRLSAAGRCNLLALDHGRIFADEDLLFREHLDRFEYLARIGMWDDAQAVWPIIENVRGERWRKVNRSRLPSCVYAQTLFWKGTLQEKHLRKAERAARDDKNHLAVRDLHRLRGMWCLERDEWRLAAASFQEAVRMARERGIYNAEAESGLALAKFHLGQLGNPRQEAEQLAQTRKIAHRLLAKLWLAIDDHDNAKKHALAAYKWAWADGEPFVHRYELTKTVELFRQLGIAVPNLPSSRPDREQKLPWEEAVAAFTRGFKAERPQ